MSFPKYPKYKDSGVEWLGEMPEHWSAMPIKYLGRLKGGSGFPHDKQGVEGEELSFHKVNSLAQADSKGFLLASDDTISRATAALLGAFVFPPKSIVFAKVGAALLLGRIRLLRDHACIDNNMMGLVIRHDMFCVEFVRYAMTLVQFDLIANPGAVPSLNEGQIGDVQLLIPPNSEQHSIASFLDRETAKIDELVAEQRRLIELLKEKRQAVISHAVTKGLNPHAPMKPSGIEWLGDVPEHWRVMKGSLIGKLFGSEQVPEESVFEEGDLPFIKVGSMSLNSFEIGSWDWFVDRAVADQYVPRSNYIVFPKRGAAIFTNKVNIVERPSLIDPNLMGWEINDEALPKFIAYTLTSRKLDELADVSTVPQINNKHIDPERFPVPPVDEQRDIVAFIDSQTAKLDALTAEAQRAIDLLQERRTALISAAVTGKIDVRGLIETGGH